MPKGQFIENIKNIFQRRAQPQSGETLPAAKEAEPEKEPAPGPETIAAIAAALDLSERAEKKTASGTDITAVIAAALHLHLTAGVAAEYVGGKKIYETTPWCEYGREQIQSARFRVFNRPVSTDKILSIRER